MSEMMKKLLTILVSVSVIVGIAPLVLALVFVPAIVQPSGIPVIVPDVAVDKSPVLKGIQPGTLERTIFIHYANGKVVSTAKTPTCYKLLGVKWKSLPINYVVHPDVEAAVPRAILASTETWDAATSKELFNENYTVDPSANWDIDYPDGRNEYSFGNYPEEGVIAVTVVWSGIPIGGKGRQIIEYDVLFDTDFNWFDCTQTSCTAENKGMDLQNIATHETGHGVGLDDVYDTACSEVTMYGYSTYGEIKKRDLETPDIIGLQKLYGA
jgi:hypothetical protein